MAAPPRIVRWWQGYVEGEPKAPQDIYRAALSNAPVAHERFFGVPDDAPGLDAPARLRSPGSFLKNDGLLRQWEKADWQSVDRRLVYWAAAFQEAARVRGIPLYVHSAMRTEAEQRELVARGVSRTAYPYSAHNIGEAVDIVHGVYHWDMSPQEWLYLSKLGFEALRAMNGRLPKKQQLELEWGGHWKFYDPAHWQIAGYKARVRRLALGEPVRRTPRFVLKNLGL